MYNGVATNPTEVWSTWKKIFVAEAVQNKTATLTHINDKINPADIFTKEDKDTIHYLGQGGTSIYILS